MLLKFPQYQKRNKLGSNGKPQRGSATGSKKMAASKCHRKGKGAGNKKLNSHKVTVPKREEVRVDPCDNSNDSGLGFDHHFDFQSNPNQVFPHSQTRWAEERSLPKRPRLVDIKLESDDANDNFTFSQTIRPTSEKLIGGGSAVCSAISTLSRGKLGRAGVATSVVGNGVCSKVRSIGKRGAGQTAGSPSVAKSSDGSIQLEIVSQPETQHRARYQTEGSRGAVKDTTGNSFPLVKLSGYEGSDKAVLQVYIGTDQGKVAPHMFYQACKVSGKNSTPCQEKKVNGTVVIEIDFNPSQDMLVLCDCVGILKERNVDVEHRFPEESSAKSRKKSTRCRMVFRSTVTLRDGSQETLQVTSHPIVCTQPPGVPEICKKSLTSCPASGGVELFIIGKNFLKDTRVRFSEGDPSPGWDYIVHPDKEYLHQSHLVCSVPAYLHENIKDPVTVNVSVVSGGKASEPVLFTYTPKGTFPTQRSSPYYALPQDLSVNAQNLVTRLPDTFASPQKMLCVNPSISMQTSSVLQASPVSSNLLGENKVLKQETEWIKEEMTMGLISAGLGENNGIIGGQQQMVPDLGNTVVGQAQPMEMAHTSPGGGPIMHSPVSATSMVHSPPGLVHSPVTSLVPSPNNSLVHSPSHSLIVQTSPLACSPPSQPIMPSQASPIVNLAASTSQELSQSLVQSPPVMQAGLDSSIIPNSIVEPGLLSPLDRPILQSPNINPGLIQSNNLESNIMRPPCENLMQSPSMDSSLIQTAGIDAPLIASSIDNGLMQTPNCSSRILQPSIVETSMMQSNLVETSLLQTSSPSSLLQNSSLSNSNIMQDANPNILQSGIERIRGNSIMENRSLMVELGVKAENSGARAVADLNSGQLPSMATMEKFVSTTPLPALSVETYLSHIEKPKDQGYQSQLLTTIAEPQPPIAMKQMVAVAAVAAALEVRPSSDPVQSVQFSGKSLDNLGLAQASTVDTTSHQFPTVTQALTDYQTSTFLQPNVAHRTEFSQPLYQEPPSQASTLVPVVFPEQAATKPEGPKNVSASNPTTKKCEEGLSVPHDFTVMSENDLISYINPSCFDQV